MSDLSTTLDEVLADVQFAAPVSVDDCQALYDAVKEIMKVRGDVRAEVYCNKGDEVVVRVYTHYDGVITRILPVT